MLSLAPSTLASVGTFRTTESVRLRSEPSTDADVVAVVNSGAEVEVLDHNPAGWSRVQTGGSTGFIRSDFLRFPISGGTATFRTTAGVNLRASASMASNVLVTVAAGASVDVNEHDPAGWSRVTINGTSGFIRSDFLTRGGDGSAAVASVSIEATSTEASVEAASSASGTLRTTGAVNLREGASTNDRIIRT